MVDSTKNNVDLERIGRRLSELERDIPALSEILYPSELDSLRSELARLRSNGVNVSDTLFGQVRRIENEYSSAHTLYIAAVISAAL